MYCIGISFKTASTRTLEAAVFKKEKRALLLEGVYSFPLSAEGVHLFQRLPPFQSGQEVQVYSGLLGSCVWIRKIGIPLKEKTKVLKALPFQLETVLPYPIEEAVICPLLTPGSLDSTLVTVVATRQESIEEHLRLLQEWGIQSEGVSCDPSALARFTQWSFPEEGKVLSFVLEENRLLYVVSERGDILLSQTSAYVPSLLDLEKLSIFLKQKGVIDDETPWYLYGEHSDRFTQVFLGKRLETADHHPLAIGYALEGCLQDGRSVSFSQKRFAFQHVTRRRNRWALFYTLCSLSCALIACLASHWVLGKKQQELVEKMNQDLPVRLAVAPGMDPNLLEEKLFAWDRLLNKEKNGFPFLPTAFKVSDVLAWLSTHSAFASEEGNKKEGIELQSFHYQLIKYPKIGEDRTPYVATCDIEFTANPPRLARDFHEALLKGDALVNRRKEIRWQVQDKTYFTSFELNPVALP